MVISMLKIRRPLGRLIFNMGIAIPGKTVFLIETAPSLFIAWSAKCNTELVKENAIRSLIVIKNKPGGEPTKIVANVITFEM